MSSCLEHPTSAVQKTVQIFLSEYKDAQPAGVKQKLTLYHSKPPH